MEKDNIVIITTFIGSGVKDPNFLDQRMNILKYSTIPSLIDQIDKNFIWCVYLDKMNNTSSKCNQIVKFLENYKKKLNIHILKYNPILDDGSLCIDNRGRSCSSKRYELYLKSIEFCEKNGYLKDVKYVSHLMLDDDDPVLERHIRWINSKVETFKNKLNFHKAVIVINKNQFIFYLSHLTLISIKSFKSMKGSCFFFTKRENAKTVNFHPYSILEQIENNFVYKDKYNISCEIVEDNPSWIYFRHRLSTSAYSKDFLIEKKISNWQGEKLICRKLKFYRGRKLNQLLNSLNCERKSKDIVKWKNIRKIDRKKIIFIIEGLKKYDKGLKLAVYLKNNFNIYVLGLEDKDINYPYIKENWRFFKNSSYFQTMTCKKGINKNIALKIIEFSPDHAIIFGNFNKLINLKYYLKKKSIPFDYVDLNDNNHMLFNHDYKNIKFWTKKTFFNIYELFISTFFI